MLSDQNYLTIFFSNIFEQKLKSPLNLVKSIPHVNHPTKMPETHVHHVEHNQKTGGSFWISNPAT